MFTFILRRWIGHSHPTQLDTDYLSEVYLEDILEVTRLIKSILSVLLWTIDIVDRIRKNYSSESFKSLAPSLFGPNSLISEMISLGY